MELKLMQLFQNLVYISHAKEDYHLVYYVYYDMFLVMQVKILLGDISLNEAEEKEMKNLEI
jgi:hypothetical protein